MSQPPIPQPTVPRTLTEEEKAKLVSLFDRAELAYADVQTYLLFIAGELGPELGGFYLRMAAFEEQNRNQLIAQRAEVLR